MVQASGFKTVVLDNDLATIQLMRRFGFKGYFGDPSRPELLKAAGLETAKVIVVAVDDKQASIDLVRYARRVRPDIAITARAHDRLHVYELYDAGADHIVREMFDSSLRAARYVLEDMGLTDYEAHEMETAFYRHDRQTLRELAELWQPGVPLTDNAAYVAKARELNNNLETALLAQLDKVEETPADRLASARRCRRAQRICAGPGRSAANTRRGLGPDTPASAKVAMPEWQAKRPRRIWIASAAPDPSPRRMPSDRSGALPNRSSSGPWACSAETWPATA
jgi:hypothetical protein